MRLSMILKRVLQDLYRLRFALVLLFIYGVLTQTFFHTVCPFAILTGFPCPACGMTRAVFLMLSGNFTASFAVHPLALLFPALLLYLGIFRYIIGRPAPFAWFFCITACLMVLVLYLFRFIAGTLPEVPCTGLLPYIIRSVPTP